MRTQINFNIRDSIVTEGLSNKLATDIKTLIDAAVPEEDKAADNNSHTWATMDRGTSRETLIVFNISDSIIAENASDIEKLIDAKTNTPVKGTKLNGPTAVIVDSATSGEELNIEIHTSTMGNLLVNAAKTIESLCNYSYGNAYNAVDASLKRVKPVNLGWITVTVTDGDDD